MNARRVVLQRCQLIAEDVQGVDRSRVVQILEILLLQQQELHLDEVGVLCGEFELVCLDNRLQFLEIIVGLMPVAA